MSESVPQGPEPITDPAQAEVDRLRNELAIRDGVILELTASLQQSEEALTTSRAAQERALSILGVTNIEDVIRPQSSEQTAKGFLGRMAERLPYMSGRRLAAVATAGAIAVGTIVFTSNNKDSLSVAPAKAATVPPNFFNSPSKASTVAKESAHATMLTRAESADTVSEAVKILHSTPSTIKANIHSIFSESHKQRLNHDKGSMSSLRAEFGNRQLSPIDYAEAVAFSVNGSEGYAAKEYNVIHGNPDSTALPQGVSVQQARQSIENVMTAQGTTFEVTNPNNGLLLKNHGQTGENVFDANVIQLNGDKEVFIIHTADGKSLYFKVFGSNCVNILTKVAQAVNVAQPQPTPTPAPEFVPVPSHPGSPVHHGRHHKKPRPPKVVNHPRPPKEKPPVVPPHQPPHQPPHHHTPKTDTNTTPAGVPGENGGTGIKSPATGPGEGPAGQTPNGNGYLPQEPQVPAPPEAPTPPPLPSPPAPTGGGSESGNDGGPTQPPAGSTGNGTTIPTDDPNPQS
jgi:hypothetical protein